MLLRILVKNSGPVLSRPLPSSPVSSHRTEKVNPARGIETLIPSLPVQRESSPVPISVIHLNFMKVSAVQVALHAHHPLWNIQRRSRLPSQRSGRTEWEVRVGEVGESLQGNAHEGLDEEALLTTHSFAGPRALALLLSRPPSFRLRFLWFRHSWSKEHKKLPWVL